MARQALSMTSWATSSASPLSPSSLSRSMNRRSAQAPDSRSKAAASPAFALAISLASVSCWSPARWPASGRVIRARAVRIRPRLPAGPGRRSSRERGRPRARPAPGSHRPGPAWRGWHGRSRGSLARAARGGAGRAGSVHRRRSATGAAEPTDDRPASLDAGARRGLERQRAGVDAVPVSGRRGPVVEDVTQMAAALPADDLGAPHEQAVVRPQLHGLGHGGLVEARPSGAGVELRVRGKQPAAAAGAPVVTVLVIVHVLAGERPLGVRLAQDAVLKRGQLRPPLLVCLGDRTGGRRVAGAVLAPVRVPFLLSDI